MIDSEYIKSMNCNFERIRLAEQPEEKRYQYCIVNRGGIKGLLPCSLRIINGDAYLYYDITSKQGLNQIFRKKQIGRQWIKDFIWNLKKITQELNRYLLDSANVIWYPENIYQDLEDNRWNYLYYPYYKGDNGFGSLLEFIIEKLDYSDEALVECVYKIYEQYESYGEDYLAERIYQDVLKLDSHDEQDADTNNTGTNNANISTNTGDADNFVFDIDNADARNSDNRYVNNNEEDFATEELINRQKEESTRSKEDLKKPKAELRRQKNISKKQEVLNGREEVCEDKSVMMPVKEKRGLLSFLEGSKKKDKELREKNRRSNHYVLDFGADSSAVAEEADFYNCTKNDEYSGKTVYIENVAEETDTRRRIYDADGKMLCLLKQDSLVIGKKPDEADMIIDNSTISRIHARIYYADGEYILEDLNSTNGTFKNGLRLKPYEKRKLLVGDEIKLGSVALMYS